MLDIIQENIDNEYIINAWTILRRASHGKKVLLSCLPGVLYTC